ncbi:unnamed protein product [Angiostrongylus costaricensis]|uniref:WD_REPEATS_REGION domain-containing protein n=1 Tax=Angiostrongylus costaricensis TaxID=334426 RepID=A0A158PFQ0_ANGCS|nr:unnamed protein product [Angiostrongylus costaricensis]
MDLCGAATAQTKFTEAGEGSGNDIDDHSADILVGSMHINELTFLLAVFFLSWLFKRLVTQQHFSKADKHPVVVPDVREAKKESALEDEEAFMISADASFAESLNADDELAVNSVVASMLSRVCDSELDQNRRERRVLQGEVQVTQAYNLDSDSSFTISAILAKLNDPQKKLNRRERRALQRELEIAQGIQKIYSASQSCPNQPSLAGDSFPHCSLPENEPHTLTKLSLVAKIPLGDATYDIKWLFNGCEKQFLATTAKHHPIHLWTEYGTSVRISITEKQTGGQKSIVSCIAMNKAFDGVYAAGSYDGNGELVITSCSFTHLLQLVFLFGSMYFMCLCAQPKEEKSQGRMPINRNTQQLALQFASSSGSVNRVKTEAIRNKPSVLEQKATSQASAEVKQSLAQDGKKSSRKGGDQKPDSVRKRKRKDGDSISIQDTEGKPQENLALLAAAEQMENDNCEGKTLSEVNKADLALLHEVENMKQEQSAYENFGPSGGDAEGADNAKNATRQKSRRAPKTEKIVRNLGSDFDVEGTQVEKSASRKLLPEPAPPLRERRSASHSKYYDR